MSGYRDSKRPPVGVVHEIAVLRLALARQHQALEVERRRAQGWEREAILRTSTVAGALSTQVLAAHRLAATIERNLQAVREGKIAMSEEISDALRFFREVERNSKFRA